LIFFLAIEAIRDLDDADGIQLFFLAGFQIAAGRRFLADGTSIE
jgi:hypothetical protein